MGLYKRAIEDYGKAINIDPKLGEGIDWFTRLLQNRKENAPTLSERLGDLQEKINTESKALP